MLSHILKYNLYIIMPVINMRYPCIFFYIIPVNIILIEFLFNCNYEMYVYQ